LRSFPSAAAVRQQYGVEPDESPNSSGPIRESRPSSLPRSWTELQQPRAARGNYRARGGYASRLHIDVAGEQSTDDFGARGQSDDRSYGRFKNRGHPALARNHGRVAYGNAAILSRR